MPLSGENLEFLKACFGEKEWAYLQNLPQFTALIAGAKNSMDDADELAAIGCRLIAEWESESRPGEY